MCDPKLVVGLKRVACSHDDSGGKEWRLSSGLAFALLCLVTQGCCSTGSDDRAPETPFAVRRSQVVMGGAVFVPPFAEPTTVDQLGPGTSESRIVEMIGLPWRRFPAGEGELWVWDTTALGHNITLTVTVVGGKQRGDAVAVWRNIPEFMVHYGTLTDGLSVSSVEQILGSPTRWENVGGRMSMVWESAVNLERMDGSWHYSESLHLCSLRLGISNQRVQSIPPIEAVAIVAVK